MFRLFFSDGRYIHHSCIRSIIYKGQIGQVFPSALTAKTDRPRTIIQHHSNVSVVSFTPGGFIAELRVNRAHLGVSAYPLTAEFRAFYEQPSRSLAISIIVK